MTLRELKALIDQIPQERLDDTVMIAAGEKPEKDELAAAVQEVKPEFHSDDKFENQWELYDNTVSPVVGIEISYEGSIYIVRD